MILSRALLVLALVACSGTGIVGAEARPDPGIVAAMVATESPPALVRRAHDRRVSVVGSGRPVVERAGDDGLDRLFGRRGVREPMRLRPVVDTFPRDDPPRCVPASNSGAPSLGSGLL